MTHFLLVHGAFHDATCWNKLIPELEALGHKAEAIDLPSHGADSTPVDTVNLMTYSEAVLQKLKVSPEPLVLVGHSMGGMVITQAADKFIAQGGKIKQLAYVCAFVPRDGQSLVDISAQPEGAGDMVQENVEVAGEPPIGIMPGDKAREAFYGQCSRDIADEAISKLNPQPILAFVIPVSILNDREIDRRYVATTEDRAIPLALQRKMSKDTEFKQVVEMDSDHSPFLSHPQELAKILVSFV